MPKVITNTSAKIEVDSNVTFEDNDGNTIEAKVTKIKGKTATCEDDDNTYQVPLSELTLVDEDADADADDEAPPTKRVKGKVVDDDDDDDDDDKGARRPVKGGKGKSLASAFNSSEKAAAGGGIPEGEWDALVVDAKLVENDKGISAYIEFVCTNDDDEDAYAKTSRKYYGLLDSDGSVQKGMPYFKTDLATLGHDDLEFEDDDDIKDLLKKVAKEHAWLEINCVKRTDDPRYCNIYINAMKDEQDDKPDLSDIPY